MSFIAQIDLRYGYVHNIHVIDTRIHHGIHHTGLTIKEQFSK